MSATQRVVSQTGTKSFTQNVVLECSGVDSLPSCRSLAFLASHDILETAGLHAHGSPGALYGMLEWCCADGLSA